MCIIRFLAKDKHSREYMDLQSPVFLLRFATVRSADRQTDRLHVKKQNAKALLQQLDTMTPTQAAHIKRKFL